MSDNTITVIAVLLITVAIGVAGFYEQSTQDAAVVPHKEKAQ